MNQPTIPLSQLQCYLAFGLKIIYLSDNSERDMIFLDTSRDDYSHIFKPLVIPLTSLTDQQWAEVFKAGLNTDICCSYKVDVNSNSTRLTLIPSGRDFFYSYSDNHFDTDAYRFNSLSAFQKLFELHADVWGSYQN